MYPGPTDLDAPTAEFEEDADELHPRPGVEATDVRRLTRQVRGLGSAPDCRVMRGASKAGVDDDGALELLAGRFEQVGQVRRYIDAAAIRALEFGAREVIREVAHARTIGAKRGVDKPFIK